VFVKLVRFASEDFGLGVASAGTRSALEAANIPFIENPAGSRSGRILGADRSSKADTLNLLHMNPDQLVRDHDGVPLVDYARWKDEFTIAAWVWEARGAPHFWQSVLPVIDEIWVPSSFVATSVAGHVSCPVVTIPHVVNPPPATGERSALGLARDKFLFLFVFDALSNLTRKNPAGLIQAYCNAFDPSGDVQLVLKCNNLTRTELESLHAMKSNRPDITIINQPLSRLDASALIAACDCYVSLHRAEGFGLTMAEAMFYGKPVIATGYSGNVDFMAGGFGFLVDYRMTVSERDCGYYRAGTEWGDPDLDHAAGLMRYVVDHPEIARSVGRAAAQKMRDEYSAEAVGRRIKDRLSLLMNSGAFRRYQ
jgi:glycosyltransferase involved in cell wall biosynthesis